MFHHLFKRYKYVNTRQHLRIPVTWPVKVKVLSRATDQEYQLLSSTRDVGAGGIALVVNEKFPTGSRLAVEIHVPPLNRSIPTEAEVVRCLPIKSGGFDLGLRFLKIAPQDREELDAAIKKFYSQREQARQQKGGWWRKASCVVGFFFLCPMAWGVESTHGPISIDMEALRRPAGESQNFWEFLKERTKLGVGYDGTYNDNVFLRDNNKQDDFISILESQILFADPRGNLLYGFTYEVNATRYHKKNQNAIDHDVICFFDLDTGGRTVFRQDYRMQVTNSLLLGPDKIDVLRRNAKFQRRVEHTWNSKLRYAMNETNFLVPQVEYSLFDDQSVNDADTDRKIFKGIIDVDHDLKPGWTLLGGYEFRDAVFPGRKLKSSESHGLRLGTRYELTKIVKLDLVSRFEHRRFRTDQQTNNISFDGMAEYQLGSRTKLLLNYSDGQIPSYSANRLQFRSTKPSLEVVYELTPLVEMKIKTAYEKQRSGGRDVLAGSPRTVSVSRRYDLGWGIQWRIREQTHVNLDYIFSRSKTSDYTNHALTLGFEAEL